jgi:hypothetical protein
MGRVDRDGVLFLRRRFNYVMAGAIAAGLAVFLPLRLILGW